MGPKKNANNKEAAGGKKSTTAAAKTSNAATKKSAAKKPATKASGSAPTRKRLPRAAKGTQPPGPEDDQAEVSEDENMPDAGRPTRSTRSAAATGGKPHAVAKAPTAPPPGTRKRKNANNDDAPASKRPRKGKGPATGVRDVEDQPDVEDVQDEIVIDDDADEPHSDLADIDQLASVETDVLHFTSRRGPDVALRFRIQVYKDPEHTDCRLFYRLRMFMTLPGQEQRKAGFIHAYRISKATTARPAAEQEAWIRELLQEKRLNRVPEGFNETAICLRALFTPDGDCDPEKVTDAAVRDRLNGDSLLFIEMIHVHQDLQQRGLLTPVIQNWQLLLQQLPEWVAFAGNAVMVPGKPDSDAGRAAWPNTSDAEAERILTNAYLKQGFNIWADKAPVGGKFEITVMGKALPEVDAAANEQEAEE